MQVSDEDCDLLFKQQLDRNPLTGRKIKTDGQTAKRLRDLCTNTNAIRLDKIISSLISLQKLRQEYCKKVSKSLCRQEDKIMKGVANTRNLGKNANIDYLEKELISYTEELISFCSNIPRNELPVDLKLKVNFGRKFIEGECNRKPIPDRLKDWYNKTDDGYVHKNIMCHVMANGKHIKFYVGQELPSAGEIFEVVLVEDGWYGIAVRKTDDNVLGNFLRRLFGIVASGISSLLKWIIWIIKIIVILLRNVTKLVLSLISRYYIILIISLAALAMLSYKQNIPMPSQLLSLLAQSIATNPALLPSVQTGGMIGLVPLQNLVISPPQLAIAPPPPQLAITPPPSRPAIAPPPSRPAIAPPPPRPSALPTKIKIPTDDTHILPEKTKTQLTNLLLATVLGTVALSVVGIDGTMIGQVVSDFASAIYEQGQQELAEVTINLL